MKKFSLFKTHTCWMQGLLISSIAFFIVFIISFAILVFNIQYNNEIAQNPSLDQKDIAYNYDVKIFPATIIIFIVQTITLIYVSFNYFSWINSLKYSPNKYRFRKEFNFIIVVLSTLGIFGLAIDTLIKFIGISTKASDFFSENSYTNGPYCLGEKGWQMQPYLIFVISLFSFITYGSSFLIQKIVYKSEYTENHTKLVSDHYREMDKNLYKKEYRKQKQKQKDLSKRIKIF